MMTETTVGNENAGQTLAPVSLLDDNYANGKPSWQEWITSAEGSADRFGDRDVVPAAMARELAARLDQCYRDRMDRHEQARMLAK